MSPDYDFMKKNYPHIKEAKWIDILSEQNKFSYMIVKMPMMSARDYVT